MDHRTDSFIFLFSSSWSLLLLDYTHVSGIIANDTGTDLLKQEVIFYTEESQLKSS